jgi:hypothetical protein
MSAHYGNGFCGITPENFIDSTNLLSGLNGLFAENKTPSPHAVVATFNLSPPETLTPGVFHNSLFLVNKTPHIQTQTREFAECISATGLNLGRLFLLVVNALNSNHDRQVCRTLFDSV